ncbi:RNA pseudouridine synthase [Helicobacter pylori]|uniref:RluA family pseudouridine synthase n=1 Tax=Helicobacter pylori TaxID=210 RepID=UPI0009A2ECEF|nr:RluA family pseudouridine synthase [Helicobacter pylori]NHA20486.1 RluA family pseudouridine synthase [Helicobacter pylori]OPG22702.1 RNA pseudouridine synthase [Helicobacter pylori]QEF26243.1 RluA family pseudouridine synthase [Helicobacter pylori]
MEKAYKLLSVQENISHKKAKALIDSGLVSIGGQKLRIARKELPQNTCFSVQKVEKPSVIFEDENILALFKPPFIESYDLVSFFKDWALLHRLDKETSGVILLVKENSEFHLKAKKAFKDRAVKKEYLAIVQGIVEEEREINAPILTIKTTKAFSKISKKGQEAVTIITPLKIINKKTLLKVGIKTGRTHQIRVHLKHINHPIIGDTLYNNDPSSAKRLMLHAHKIALLGYEFEAIAPKEFEI